MSLLRSLLVRIGGLEIAYKKLLSIYEIDDLIAEHKETGVFRTNHKGEKTLDP